MGDWSTYHLSDFLLFSERVYRRLFEAHNAAWWPLPVALAVLGAVAIAVLIGGRARGRSRPRRAAWIGLGTAWLFVAVAFLHARYAPINPPAAPAAGAFAAQGVALMLYGILAPHGERPGGWRLALGLFFALWGLLYPVGAWTRDGAWGAAEWFGMAPDPTAIVTIGAIVMGVHRRALVAALLVVPIAWCALSALTLRAMDEREMIGAVIGGVPFL